MSLSVDYDQEGTYKNLSYAINFIVNSSLRHSHLKQIGRLPKFFDPTAKVQVPGYDVEVWPGVQATSHFFLGNLYLEVETLNKILH